MADLTPSDNEMITSFSNPNYQLNDADALNSNLPSQYFSEDGTNIYEEVNFPDSSSTNSSPKTNSSLKRRKKYAHMNLTSMGVDLDPSATSSGEVTSPESMTSASEVDSAIISPDEEMTQSIVQVEHTESDDADENEEPKYQNVTSSRSETKSKGFLGYYASLELSAKASQENEKDEDGKEETSEEEEEDDKSKKDTSDAEKSETQESFEDKAKDINSPDSNDSGIQADVQHIQAPESGDLYAVVQKKKAPPKSPEKQVPSPSEDKELNDEILPAGWEKHEDEDGPYYWHIKSGTIQRQPPAPVPETKRSISTTSNESSQSETPSVSSDTSADALLQSASSSATPTPPPLAPFSQPSPTEKSTKNHLQEFEGHAFKTRGKDRSREPIHTVEPSEPIRFAVRSLGWVRIAEEDLTPERSSKAVNKCIVDLSLGRNDINDVVGRWGDGKDLFMDLDSQNLTLIDPQDFSVLNVQPIQSIRVWGVGRDNGRDFAYVARDRMSRKHMCHVFRCDTPARQIANTLRDICKRIMMERSVAQGAAAGMQRLAISRPNNLAIDHGGQQGANGEKISTTFYRNASFPTPMEEPKKVLRCHYLGPAQVPKGTGVEVLNSAMEKVYSRVPPEKWMFVSVAIAPSTITITEHGTDNVLAECRVRFLSFMGIAMRNVKMCSFIMHTAQDRFLAHVFHCEPSAGALCKTIEAACKLRYQKCLDAHPTTPDSSRSAPQHQNKSIGASIKSVLGSIGKGRKVKS